MTDAEKAYLAIKDKIVTLDMPPGSSIVLADLADELGLGRTPVREALKQLQAENLVVVLQRRGMSVAEIALTDLRQLYEMRVLLEPACARMAATRMSPAQVAELVRALEDLQRIDPQDRRRRLSSERRIHGLIAQGCSNKLLEAEARQFFELSLRIWYLVLDRLPAEAVDADTHAALVQAIASRDAALAEECMRRHVDHFYEMAKAEI
jgi:DNA-binding GntR family transcriptional regulator